LSLARPRASMIAVYTGPRHSGKTTRLAALCREWRAAGRRVGGFLSIAVRKGGLESSFSAPGSDGRDGGAGLSGRAGLEASLSEALSDEMRGQTDGDPFVVRAEGPAGYDLLEIKTAASYPFLRRADTVPAAGDLRTNDRAEDRAEDRRHALIPFLSLNGMRTRPPSSLPCSRHSLVARPGESRESAGRWIFVPGGLARAREIIRFSSPDDLLVVDEFGPLEFRGGGVRPAFDEALRAPGRRVLVVVREALWRGFLESYNEFSPKTYDALQPGAEKDLTRDLFGDAE